MRNAEERIQRLHERAEQLRIRKERRITAIAGAMCLVLFAALLGIVRELSGEISDVAGNAFTGSSLLSSEAGAYILVAVIAFMLGVIVTVIIRKYISKNRSEGISEDIL
ncbi:MAG: hypothetical protein J6P36_04710 [Lachnospiraceae bacterium]|nr:hypothetical protein [Lachnospiraceae bacterium]